MMFVNIMIMIMIIMITIMIIFIDLKKMIWTRCLAPPELLD